MMRKSLSAITSALMTLSVQARAEDASSKVYASYGLVGIWSPACDLPAGPRNPRLRYEVRSDGLVDVVGDWGVNGLSRTTIREASIDTDHRLHAVSYARYSDLTQAVRDRIKFSWATPDVTFRSIGVMGSDGSFTTVDQIVETLGGASTAHPISGGFVINQQTGEPGPKMTPAFKCPQ